MFTDDEKSKSAYHTIARFYGTVDGVHKSGPAYDKVWEKLIQSEKNNDPEKKGYAVTIKVERAEDLRGQPIAGS